MVKNHSDHKTYEIDSTFIGCEKYDRAGMMTMSIDNQEVWKQRYGQMNRENLS